MNVIFLGDFFERTFTKMHSVFSDQINSMMSAAHSNKARVCSSVVVKQTTRFISKQLQMGSAEERAPTEKGVKMVGKSLEKVKYSLQP